MHRMHPGRTHQRVVIAHHIIITLYGHWPPNDPRGSGSRGFHDDKFAALGPIHNGRRPAHLQPSRAELREYHAHVKPLLNFPIIWLDDATRQVVAEAFADVVRRHRYTCCACAVLKNHAHLLIRRHRDTYQAMFSHLAAAAREAMHSFAPLRLDADHPVISQRPYAAYCYAPNDIRRCIDYIDANPGKEGLPSQRHTFVMAYDNWPQRSRR
jgi:REP element-mobilizing transposase RayT